MQLITEPKQQKPTFHPSATLIWNKQSRFVLCNRAISNRLGSMSVWLMKPSEPLMLYKQGVSSSAEIN